MSEFGDWIMEQRLTRGWTQREMAEHCEVSESAISRWEHGGEPRERLRFRVLRALGEEPRPEVVQGEYDGFAEWLADWRESGGISLEEAGRRLGFVGGTISRWEQGDPPSDKSRRRVAERLGLQVSDLSFTRDWPAPPVMVAGGCEDCRYYEECERVVQRGGPAYCEGASAEELAIYTEQGILEDILERYNGQNGRVREIRETALSEWATLYTHAEEL